MQNYNLIKGVHSADSEECVRVSLLSEFLRAACRLLWGAMGVEEYLPPLAVTGLSLVSYLLLYTAYSKMNKTLEPALLIKVLTMSEGLEHTLVEMNKAISLAGLTVLALAFCPGFDAMRWELLWHAMVLLWTHSCYSAYQFYGATHIPLLSEFPTMLADLSSDNAKTRVRTCFASISSLTAVSPPSA
jgi:hypothetical protein